jgi:hypothetical protein
LHCQWLQIRGPAIPNLTLLLADLDPHKIARLILKVCPPDLPPAKRRAVYVTPIDAA